MTLHLLSGGLDSVTLLYELQAANTPVHALMVDYGQAHVKELDFAKSHCERLGIASTRLKLPTLGGLTDQNWIIPNRNAILLSLAVNTALHLGADSVTIGCNADDRDYFPDCQQSFLDAMNVAVKAAGYDIALCAPYLNKRKWEIGSIAQNLGITSDSIWTCYRGGDRPCGKCPACEKLPIR